ncbi:MAG TPA: peptidylprolyl isomerase [Candidatus Eisenbacteria bacterium]|nr:peptidylprolyl isomerase [Candidatus Eisenbacteria bacterium]
MQSRSMAVIAISCVLIGSAAAQTTSPSGTPVPRLRGAEKQASIAAATGNTTANVGNPDAVGMDQPVITLKDGCKPIGDITPAQDCVSEVTRAQFEKLANALQPGMAAEAKRGFANNYGRLLVYSDAARALNLENNPDVQLILQFLTNQVLAEGLRRHYAEEFAHPSDQQIQEYYDKNSAKYLEATLERIIIPRNPGSSDKPAPSEEEQKAAAEKFRQRWVAGEDPVKLQQAAYQAAGVTGAGTPEINLGARRRGSLPVNQETVFQLKAGEISPVFDDPAAFYVYKVVSIREIPLSEEKDSIVKTLQQQKLQDKLEQIGKSATPVLNEEYFGPAAVSGAGAATHPTPSGTPSAGNPPK